MIQLKKVHLVTAILLSIGDSQASRAAGSVPYHLTIGYDNEEKIDASAQACLSRFSSKYGSPTQRKKKYILELARDILKTRNGTGAHAFEKIATLNYEKEHARNGIERRS